MKAHFVALAAIASCALVANSAYGQTLKHPASVRPVSLSNDSYYDYYYDDEEEASPSDAAPVAEPEEPAKIDEPAKDYSVDYSVGCSSSCDGGCDSLACGGCGSCGSCYLFGPDEAFSLWPENCSNIQAGGWTQLGYHNKITPLSTARGELFSFNDVPNSVNLQQQWFYLEKTLSGDSDSWDWGGRVDLMYGTDAQKTQAFGTPGGWDNDWDHGVYGFAAPQAYLEVGKGNFSIKGGHFFTMVGYEVITAPDNFFYSHALTMFNSEPFTHTGAVATYSVTENLDIYGGWTAGWDTGFRAIDGGSSWLGGFAYSIGDNVTMTYISTAGNFGWRGSDAYSHSVVFDVSVTDNLNYVFQTDYLHVQDQTGFLAKAPEDREENLGINQYLIYKLNDCLGVGARCEWWKAEGNSFYEATLGLNYRPMANVVFRPEIRQDWQPYANFDQTTLGIDAILVY